MPGTGTSFFGLYAAFRLLSDDVSPPPALVWESRRRCTRTLVRGDEHNDNVAVGTLDDFRAELSDPRTVYLPDDPLFPGPWHVEARTLALASLRRDAYRLLLKAPAATERHLPPWRWGEVEACRQLLYTADATRSRAAVRDAFDRWGGVPRFVLDKLNDVPAQAELRAALLPAHLDEIPGAWGDLSAASDACHVILHAAAPPPRYLRGAVDFGSEHIAAAALRHLLTWRRAEVAHLANAKAAGGDDARAPLRRRFAAALAAEAAAAGGEQRRRGGSNKDDDDERMGASMPPI